MAYVDSQFIGAIPKSLETSTGPHTLRIESHGYQTILESLTVNGGETTAIEKILVPVTAVITSPVVSPTTQVTITNLPPVSAVTGTQTIPLTAGIGIFAPSIVSLLWCNHRKK
jgi:hypothetical protein